MIILHAYVIYTYLVKTQLDYFAVFLVWSGWLLTSLISFSKMVRRASGSSSPPFFWPVLAQRCAGLSSVPLAHPMWSSGVD